ncbi:CBO0543 family protein [Lentibacillus sp. CBA3610]|uniref:CBO0543 family protein n=1 Tax=Lentibacillus sp. CBA3610 TaxID=2518176 RepID=UPI001594FB94|nr:CBO0543 family protein [Lentibacillus sp. CBA3610]QKY68802.1 hypothetical protein Len3610_03480 [Lentibacillus sp. CBA3610]
MHILIIILVLIAVWRKSDWSRFHQFHATMIYMGTMNLLYIYFTTDYPLWTLHSNIGLPEPILNLLYTFIVFPCTVIMFLSRFPGGWLHQVYYAGKWVLVYFVFEWIGYHAGAIDYNNGWSLIWSFQFLIVMFPMLRLHYVRPFLTYGLSVIIIAILLSIFEVPWLNN